MPTGEFVSFSFGEQQDYAKDDTLDLSNVEIGMGLDWQGSDPNIGTGFQVVKGTAYCQCVFNFCSTACLRRFMNTMVDELESLVERALTPLDKPEEKGETISQPGDAPNTHSPSAQGVGGR